MLKKTIVTADFGVARVDLFTALWYIKTKEISTITASRATRFGIVKAVIAEAPSALFSQELEVMTTDIIIVITAEKTPINVRT